MRFCVTFDEAYQALLLVLFLIVPQPQTVFTLRPNCFQYGLGPNLSRLQESGDYHEYQTTIRFHENPRPGTFRWLEILATCQQFRQEVLRILLAQNMLCFVGSGWPRLSNGTRIRHKTIRLSSEPCLRFVKHIFVMLSWQLVDNSNENIFETMLQF